VPQHRLWASLGLGVQVAINLSSAQGDASGSDIVHSFFRIGINRPLGFMHLTSAGKDLVLAGMAKRPHGLMA